MHQEIPEELRDSSDSMAESHQSAFTKEIISNG